MRQKRTSLRRDVMPSGGGPKIAAVLAGLAKDQIDPKRSLQPTPGRAPPCIVFLLQKPDYSDRLLDKENLSHAETSTRRCAEPTRRNSRPSPEGAREGGLIGIAEIDRNGRDCDISLLEPLERFAPPYIGQQV